MLNRQILASWYMKSDGTFGGADDPATVTQSLMNWCAANNHTLVFDAGDYLFVRTTTGLTIPDNARILLKRNARILRGWTDPSASVKPYGEYKGNRSNAIWSSVIGWTNTGHHSNPPPVGETGWWDLENDRTFISIIGEPGSVISGNGFAGSLITALAKRIEFGGFKVEATSTGDRPRGWGVEGPDVNTGNYPGFCFHLGGDSGWVQDIEFRDPVRITNADAVHIWYSYYSESGALLEVRNITGDSGDDTVALVPSHGHPMIGVRVSGCDCRSYFARGIGLTIDFNGAESVQVEDIRFRDNICRINGRDDATEDGVTGQSRGFQVGVGSSPVTGAPLTKFSDISVDGLTIYADDPLAHFAFGLTEQHIGGISAQRMFDCEFNNVSIYVLQPLQLCTVQIDNWSDVKLRNFNIYAQNQTSGDIIRIRQTYTTAPIGDFELSDSHIIGNASINKSLIRAYTDGAAAGAISGRAEIRNNLFEAIDDNCYAADLTPFNYAHIEGNKFKSPAALARGFYVANVTGGTAYRNRFDQLPVAAANDGHLLGGAGAPTIKRLANYSLADSIANAGGLVIASSSSATTVTGINGSPATGTFIPTTAIRAGLIQSVGGRLLIRARGSLSVPTACPTITWTLTAGTWTTSLNWFAVGANANSRAWWMDLELVRQGAAEGDVTAIWNLSGTPTPVAGIDWGGLTGSGSVQQALAENETIEFDAGFNFSLDISMASDVNANTVLTCQSWSIFA